MWKQKNPSQIDLQQQELKESSQSHDHIFWRSLEIVKSAPPKPSITAFAEGNSALDVKLVTK